MAAVIPIAPDLRQIGEEDEIAHWRQFVESERFLKGWLGPHPNHEIDVEAVLFITAVALPINFLQGRPARVLDIGSGPVSMLSHSFKSATVSISAADPLGDRYGDLWDDPRKATCICPVACAGEALSERFGRDAFDVAHIRNALDHTEDPAEVIAAMIAVTRLGGYLYIHGFENEAEAEGWQGFHQWNIARAGTDLCVKGRESEFSVMERFGDQLRLVHVYQKPLSTGRSWCGLVAIRR